MDLSPDWNMITKAAEQRLKNNKTIFHIDKYGTDIEVLGAAGEIAARRFLGLPETLHLTKDNGVDLVWRGWTVDVKCTHMTKYLHHRYLQWPHYKPIKADIILMTAVNLKWKKGTVIGFALRHELAAAPINPKRDIPCREILVTKLHPAWKMQVMTFKKGKKG
ncbi:MAG: hypothetical protein ACWGQW_03925 [bacterium]